MKKVLFVLFGVLLMLPSVIFADMSGPEVEPYEGEITNPNGTKLYTYDNKSEKLVSANMTLEYGEVVIIMDDTYDDDNLASEWVCITLDTNDDDEEETYYISNKDVATKEKNYKPKENELSKEYNAIVIHKMEIKKGPANLYESTGVTLNVGAKVKIKYFTNYYEDEDNGNKIEYYKNEYNPWVYVEYNGTQGYINVYGGNLAVGGEENDVIIGYDTELIDIKTGKIITTIKANTKFKTPVYETDIWDRSYYIKYNDKFGITSYILYQKSEELEFKATEDILLYPEAGLDYDAEDNILTKPTGTIKKGTTFKSAYYYFDNSDCVVRYENGGTTGWIISGYNNDNLDDKHIELHPYEDDQEEYDDNDSETDVIDPKDPENNDPESIDVKPESIKKPDDKMKLIYICGGCALIVALTAAVSIVLINKKKKNTENDKKE